MRRTLYAAVAMLVLVGASEVQAQSLDLESSMTAQCLGGTCETVQFTLDVVGSVYLDVVRLFADGASLWRFGSVLEIVDGGGNIVTGSFLWGIAGDELTLSAGALLPPFLFAEPLTLTVQMASFDPSGNFLYGNVDYTANGETDPVFDGNGFFSTAGTVTPEPGTVFLLGTGLLGLTGAAWRRRKKEGLMEA